MKYKNKGRLWQENSGTWICFYHEGGDIDESRMIKNKDKAVVLADAERRGVEIVRHGKVTQEEIRKEVGKLL